MIKYFLNNLYMRGELIKLHNSDILIINFSSRFAESFEFVSFMKKTYNHHDLIFYIDTYNTWYHNGIKGITNTIDKTVIHINKRIKTSKYKKVIFIGVSAGGYASILFGSLCNATNVIAYLPQTIITEPVDIKYKDLKNIINKSTLYTIYGDPCIEDITDLHNIHHCKNITHHDNVKLIEIDNLNVKQLKYDGEIKKLLDTIINQ